MCHIYIVHSRSFAHAASGSDFFRNKFWDKDFLAEMSQYKIFGPNSRQWWQKFSVFVWNGQYIEFMFYVVFLYIVELVFYRKSAIHVNFDMACSFPNKPKLIKLSFQLFYLATKKNFYYSINGCMKIVLHTKVWLVKIRVDFQSHYKWMTQKL